MPVTKVIRKTVPFTILLTELLDVCFNIFVEIKTIILDGMLVLAVKKKMLENVGKCWDFINCQRT